MQRNWAIFLQFMIWSPTALATPSSDLYEAMEIDSSDVVSDTLSASSGATDVVTELGLFLPEMGSDMAILHTGRVGTSPEPGVDHGMSGPNGDESTLDLEISVPSYANSFSLSFAFFSAEYPEWVGWPFNDAFELNIVGTAFTGNAAVDSAGNAISINTALFTVTNPSDLSGTTFEGGIGGGTGWLMVVVPVDPSDTIQLQMTIYDVTDGSYDSAVLIDNFEWSESDIDTPTIVQAIDLFYLSPKRGSIEGGEETRLYGENFNGGCVAEFDGVEVDTTFVDSEELVAITEPHEVGLVDVRVDCPGVDATLIGAYSFYTEDAVAEPPEITGIDPYMVFTTGGETVTLTGTDLDRVSELWVDQVQIDSFTTVSETEIRFVSPAHEEGWADLSYFDTTGWSEQWLGGMLYIAQSVDTGGFDSGTEDTATEEEEEDGAATGNAGGCACSSTSSTGPGWMVLGLIALVWRRRSTSIAVCAASLIGCSEYELTENTEPEGDGEDTSVELPVVELEAPVAAAAVGAQVKRLESIVLDGSASTDPDGNSGALVYSWTVSEFPEGAIFTLENASTSTPEFSADLLGAYLIELVVTDTDGLVSENLAGTVIEVVPWENLVAILDWDTENIDVDLHMLSPDGSYYGEGDCYFGNPTPDWGEEGVSIDDPLLDGDQESGGEPETIYLWQPEEGIYTFYAHYFNPRDAETSWTFPTLRIYAEGELLTTQEGPRLTAEGKVWAAGDLDWSTLEYVESSVVTTHEEMGGPAVNEKD